MARKYTNNSNSKFPKGDNNLCENTSNNEMCKNIDHEYIIINDGNDYCNIFIRHLYI